ncbi:MAG TPA: SIMPL domain-containing protein [Bryobacteraceae bacterium]|nr:SIMPL domain-containing protein [Bryobacteraceae bacterium]
MRLIGLLCLAAVGTWGCFAQGTSIVQGVTAHGEAEITVKPDQFTIQIGVVTQAATADAAAAQNSKQTTDVISAVKGALGAGVDIKTSAYSLQPNYNYRPNAAPTITGYTANNMVQVTSSDLMLAGKVVDAATKVGANNIQGIQFSVKDEQTARAEALRQAARKARANAEALAAGLGMKLGPVISITDGEPVRVFPVREMSMAKAAQADTPVEPGNVSVHARVSVTAALIP